MTKSQQTPLAEQPVAQPVDQIMEQPVLAVPPGELTRSDIDALNKLADYLQRINLAEYLRLTQKPLRLIGVNFLSGVARGFGIAVGFTLLGALGIYVLNQLNVLNLPVIGDFIAQILEYVDIARGIRV